MQVAVAVADEPGGAPIVEPRRVARDKRQARLLQATAGAGVERAAAVQGQALVVTLDDPAQRLGAPLIRTRLRRRVQVGHRIGQWRHQREVERAPLRDPVELHRRIEAGHLEHVVDRLARVNRRS